MHEAGDQFSIWRYSVAIALIVLWLLLTAYAFWAFHFRYLHSVNSIDQWVMFSSDQMSITNEFVHDKPTLIHFHDPNCPCSRFVVPDVKNITDSFLNEVHIRVLVPDASAIAKASRLFGVEAEVAAIELQPVASPAAWLVASNGQTVYLGPYSDSGICSISESHQVAALLSDLLSGQVLSAGSHLTTGCFCSWPKTTNAS